MTMGMQAQSGAMADINVTPLVDVMLVMLIIFMVAAPVMEKARSQKELEENRDKQQRLVALNLPALDNSQATANQAQTLTLKIDQNFVVSFEGKTVSDCSKFRDAIDKRQWTRCFDEVEGAIRANEDAKDSGIIVDADPSIKFGFVVGIMHRMHKANIEKVSMFPKTTATSS